MADPSVDTKSLGVADLVGLWRRELLRDATGCQDVTTQVCWLQGPSAYIDLRRPRGRGLFTGVRDVGDLSFEQVRWLASQQAFAGRLSRCEGHFVWTRDLDLHPPGALPDAGTLQLSGNLLVETGVYEPYVEHWYHLPTGAAPACSRTLRHPATGSRAQLVRVGSAFGWVRDNRGSLPAGRSLAELVDGAASLSAAQALVDFEVCFGEVVGADWIVTASTFPFRENRPFAVDLPSWTVVHSEGEVGQ